MSAPAGSMVHTVQGLQRWIKRCNNAELDMASPFVVDDCILGYIPHDFASVITNSEVFQVRGDNLVRIWQSLSI
jgi:hypothetical protein